MSMRSSNSSYTSSCTNRTRKLLEHGSQNTQDHTLFRSFSHVRLAASMVVGVAGKWDLLSHHPRSTHKIHTGNRYINTLLHCVTFGPKKHWANLTIKQVNHAVLCTNDHSTVPCCHLLSCRTQRVVLSYRRGTSYSVFHYRLLLYLCVWHSDSK